MKVFAILTTFVTLAGVPLVVADTACQTIVTRVEADGSALSRALTEILCDFAARQEWLPAAEVESIRSRHDFRELLQRRSGLDVIDLGDRLFSSFEQAASSPAATEWEIRDTAHYRLYARQGSAAAKDFDIIATEAERTRGGLLETFQLERIVAAREAVVRTKQPTGPTAPTQSHRVAVFLYPSRGDHDIKKGIRGRGMGATNFGATIDEHGRGRLQPSMHVLYYNPFSLAVLEHEIAHTILMMAAFDPAAIDRPLSGEADLKKAFLSAYRPISPFLNEGFGDYGLYYAGFYPAWGLLGSPENLAQSLQSDGKLPSLRKLVTLKRVDRREHKAFSLASATFLRYLLETKGTDAVRQWLLSTDRSIAAFQKTQGMTIEEADRGWLAWLRTHSGS